MASATSNLYLSDFLTGLLAALALEGKSTFSLRGNRLDAAMEKLVDDLAEEARAASLSVRFRIRRDRLHGDSAALHQALFEAAQRNLIGLDNPEFQDLRLKVTRDVASRFLSELPGSPAMYERLAKKFTQHYSSAAL